MHMAHLLLSANAYPSNHHDDTTYREDRLLEQLVPLGWDLPEKAGSLSVDPGRIGPSNAHF